jgi:hypothetical protein
VSYVQLLNSDWTTLPGQALAKFTFVAQLPNEIGFAKGIVIPKFIPQSKTIQNIIRFSKFFR